MKVIKYFIFFCVIILTSSKDLANPPSAQPPKNFQQQNQPTSTADPKPIKNSDWLTFGYNIMKGNPLFWREGKNDPGFTKNSIFRLTENENNLVDGYKCPDHYQIKFLNTYSNYLKSEIYDNLDTLTSKMNQMVEVYDILSFLANPDYKQLIKKIKVDRSYIISEAASRFYSASLMPETLPMFSENFISGIKSLGNGAFEQNKKAYFKLLDTFGTHIVSEMTMGSKFAAVQEIPKKNLADFKKKGLDIQDNANREASKLASTAKGVSYPLEIAPEYVGALQDHYTLEVGAPIALPTTKLGMWVDTTKENPLPIEYKLKPLFSIFDRPEALDVLRDIKIDSKVIGNNLEKAMKPQNYCEYLRAQKLVEKCNSPAPVSRPVMWEAVSRDADDRKGMLAFLARHNVECPLGSAINSFKAFFPITGILKYRWKCVRHLAISKQCKGYTSQFDYSLSNSPFAVDKLNEIPVKCPQDTVLRQFQFGNDQHKIFYKFICCNAQTKTCDTKDKETQEVDNRDNSTFGLKNLEPSAGPDEFVLNEFALTSSGGKMKYNYKACQLKMHLDKKHK